MLRGRFPPVIVAIAGFALIVVLFSYNRKLSGCSNAGDITDRLNTQWSRPAGGGDGAHVPIPLVDHLGTVDRIDVYHNVSSVPGKSTILFAYRKSSCPDWNREHPDQLFNNRVFSSILPQGGVYVDVGACYGDTAVPLGVRADMVIAFEPNPFSFHVLKLNSLLNPGLNIRPHNFAAGDGKVSELTFTYGGDMCNGGIIGEWKDASAESQLKVQAVNLPKFLLQTYGEEVVRQISVIKVDAEGFDASILSTLHPLLQYAKPIILVEWFDYYVTSPPHGNGGPEDVHPKAQVLFDTIRALGYEPYNPDSGARIAGPQNKNKVPDVLCKPLSRSGGA